MLYMGARYISRVVYPVSFETLGSAVKCPPRLRRDASRHALQENLPSVKNIGISLNSVNSCDHALSGINAQIILARVLHAQLVSCRCARDGTWKSFAVLLTCR